MNGTIHWMMMIIHLFRPPNAVKSARRDSEPLAKALQVGISDLVDCALRGGVLYCGEGGLEVGKVRGECHIQTCGLCVVQCFKQHFCCHFISRGRVNPKAFRLPSPEYQTSLPVWYRSCWVGLPPRPGNHGQSEIMMIDSETKHDKACRVVQ